MHGLSSVDDTFQDYSLASTDDLIRFSLLIYFLTRLLPNLSIYYFQNRPVLLLCLFPESAPKKTRGKKNFLPCFASSRNILNAVSCNVERKSKMIALITDY